MNAIAALGRLVIERSGIGAAAPKCYCKFYFPCHLKVAFSLFYQMYRVGVMSLLIMLCRVYLLVWFWLTRLFHFGQYR